MWLSCNAREHRTVIISHQRAIFGAFAFAIPNLKSRFERDGGHSSMVELQIVVLAVAGSSPVGHPSSFRVGSEGPPRSASLELTAPSTSGCSAHAAIGSPVYLRYRAGSDLSLKPPPADPRPCAFSHDDVMTRRQCNFEATLCIRREGLNRSPTRFHDKLPVTHRRDGRPILPDRSGAARRDEDRSFYPAPARRRCFCASHRQQKRHKRRTDYRNTRGKHLFNIARVPTNTT